MTQQTDTMAGHRHFAEAIADDVRDAVVAREPLVNERIVGGEEVDRLGRSSRIMLSIKRSVSSLNASRRLAVELGIHVLDRCRAFEPAELQPLG